MNDQSPSKWVRTTETSLEIVDALEELKEAGMEELADHLEYAPSTVYRHLQTLRKHGYVDKRGNSYHLGFKFLSLGGATRNANSEYRIAEGYVEDLARKTGERTQFVVQENGQRVVLFRRIGEDAVRGTIQIGDSRALHSRASGKAILSQLHRKEVERIIEDYGLPAETDNTITDPEDMFEELERIRDRGYALNLEESMEKFHAIASPVTNPTRTTVGALVISGPASRLDLDRIENDVADYLMKKASELELKIEYAD